MPFSDRYPHLRFRPCWTVQGEVAHLLGQCEALVDALCHMPILPEKYRDLLSISLIKGARATTAIEGNTLSVEDIQRLQKGEHLPPSKEYLEIEVRNILDALNALLEDVVRNNHQSVITPDLLKRFHRYIGRDLGEHFDAIPGRFREDERVVGTYRCPRAEDVEPLVERYCRWLAETFHYDKGQRFDEVMLEAIVAHVYLEWIHPFGDGNGRTGRLIEFYILLRGGLPSIASHILSNHYNETRSAYYRHISEASRSGDLTGFIQYALLGFRDGLRHTMGVVQEGLRDIVWTKLIYDRFSQQPYRKKEVFKRRRELMLAFPTSGTVPLHRIPLLNPDIAARYAGLSDKTIQRDLELLQDLGLVTRTTDGYAARLDQLNALYPERVDPGQAARRS